MDSRVATLAALIGSTQQAGRCTRHHAVREESAPYKCTYTAVLQCGTEDQASNGVVGYMQP
jgi:hypothetical protein